ncbi:MAG TPA: GAF domain-containing protein, partial [Bacillota bacterium]|nr:GAF domain-containing protein [Bacillota bacterium]
MNHDNNQIEQLQRKVAQLSVLYSIGAGIGLTPDPNEVLEFVLDKAVNILRAEIGVILLFEEGSRTLTVSHARGLNKKMMEPVRIKPGAGIAGKVFQAGAMELVNDLQKKLDLMDTFIQCYPVQSVLCLPIKIRDRIRGVVHFSRLSNLKFEPDDVWILTILTQRANMALESAELYQNLKKS